MKLKDKKPKIKVEELKEESTNISSGNIDTTKITSFSQLDSIPPTISDSKDSQLKNNLNEEINENDTSLNNINDIEKSSDSDKTTSENEKISSEEVKEWLKDVRPDTTKENQKGRGIGGKVFFIVITLFLLGAISGGFIYFQKGVNKPSINPTPTETPKITPTITKAPEEIVNLKNISINVLNGSGISGEAGRVKDLLIKGGFDNDKIKTGNADSYDYSNINLSAKENISNKVLDIIKDTLKDKYKISKDIKTLNEESNFDIEIIVGK